MPAEPRPRSRRLHHGGTRRRLLAPLVAAAVVVAGFAAAAPAAAATPTVSSFTPTSGDVGTAVTITGTGFVSPVTVAFGGVAATAVTVTSATKVRATVPATAATGPITVTSGGSTATSSSSFTVLAGAVVSPAAGPPTTTTTFTVSGFGRREAVDVYVDTTAVRIGVTGATGVVTVPVVVPAAATPGTHWLTAVGRTSGAAAQVPFLVRTDQYQAGFDVGRTGANPYENVLTPTTVAKVRQQWRTPIGASVNATPAVVAGVVYASFGDGSIRAFDAATGAQRWTQATGGSSMFSSPAVSASGKTVYAGSSDKKLYALDTATGAVRWSAATGDIVYSSPVVVGSTVYVGSYDQRIYAFDATTGAVKWSFVTGAAVYASPSVVGGVVYVGSFDGSVYALRADTGVQVWTYATAGLVLAPAVVADGVVYVASEGGDVVALRARDGSVRWTSTGGAVADAIGFVDGLVVVADTGGAVRAYDAAGGSLQWARSTPGPTSLRAQIATAAGLVYVGYDSTFVLRATDGALVRSLPAGGRYGGAAVVDGTVTVGDSADGALVRYALPTPPAAAARPAPSALHR